MSRYTTTTGKFREFLTKIQTLAIPPKATTDWLESLGFKSKNDRSFLRVLRQIDFLNEASSPTENYKDFLDNKKSRLIMAKCIKKGYDILYETYPQAHKEESSNLINVFQTRENIAKDTAKLAEATFKVLCQFADFEQLPEEAERGVEKETAEQAPPPSRLRPSTEISRELSVNINIQFNLPITEDAVVYDKIFEALKKHFFSD